MFPTVSNNVQAQLLNLECQSSTCGALVRLGHRQAPGVYVGAFTFCPVCGGRAHQVFEGTEDTYWQSLADKYMLPPNIIKLMYDEWQPAQHKRFGQFVEEMKADAGL